VLEEIDRRLGYDGPPAVEYIFVEEGSGHPLRVGLGHACVRYTLNAAAREERIANVTRGELGKNVALVELWEKPEDYLLGSGGGKGGIFARSICTIRFKNWDASLIKAMHHYFLSLDASHRASTIVGFSMVGMALSVISFFLPWTQARTRANCAQFTGQGLFLAGLLSRQRIFPKAMWVDMFERQVLDKAANGDSDVHVVYFQQARTTSRAPCLINSLVSPIQVLRSLIYWDLKQFADVVVEVDEDDSGVRKARVIDGARRRPRRLRRWTKYFHEVVMAVIIVAYLWKGWPDVRHVKVSPFVARLFVVFLVLSLNSLLY